MVDFARPGPVRAALPLAADALLAASCAEAEDGPAHGAADEPVGCAAPNANPAIPVVDATKNARRFRNSLRLIVRPPESNLRMAVACRRMTDPILHPSTPICRVFTRSDSDWQIGRLAVSADWQAGRLVSRQIGKQADWQAGGLASRRTGKRAGQAAVILRALIARRRQAFRHLGRCCSRGARFACDRLGTSHGFDGPVRRGGVWRRPGA